MSGVDRYLGAIFARETAELRRVVAVARARGWIRSGAPAKSAGKMSQPAKKKPATKRGGRMGGR
jgi:hypothetical protein